MDGLDVLRLIKTLDPDIPVVMLTGTGGEAVAVEAMRSGVDDYLLKRGHEYAACRSRRRPRSTGPANDAPPARPRSATAAYSATSRSGSPSSAPMAGRLR
jgi:DNA-binding NarL/FixJ family response regulator